MSKKPFWKVKKGGHITQREINDILASNGELTDGEIAELVASGKVGGQPAQPKKQGNRWWCHITRDWIN